MVSFEEDVPSFALMKSLCETGNHRHIDHGFYDTSLVDHLTAAVEIFLQNDATQKNRLYL